MSAADLLSVLSLLAGIAFFVAGTVGMLRFPDALSRLHALTKTDTLGLGFVVAALALQAASIAVAVKLIVIWLLVLLASSSACYLIGRSVYAPQGDEHGRD